MFINSVVRKIFSPIGLEIEKIVRKNRYLRLSNWEYQKNVVLPVLPQSGVIMDIGSGHNPVPKANILADFFPEDTVHRATSLVEDRPVVVCSVERIPMLDKAIDFAICSHIVEHVDSPIRAGKELGRIAKAGYIETPAYGKDILVGTGSMHKWQIIEFEGEMHYFEYSNRQREAHVTSPAMVLWCRKRYHPWQDFFWERQDLFNAMHLWKDSPTIVEHRRGNSKATPFPAWSPVNEGSLPDRQSTLSDKEIDLLNSCLATPDGKPMKFKENKFVSDDGSVQYPVRGKRIYFEMAE